MNRGGSVPATNVLTLAGDEVAVAWDLTQCDINDYCLGDWWNITTGLTCFGLTSTTGTSVLSYIGFQPSIDEYLIPTSVEEVRWKMEDGRSTVYDLQGRRVMTSTKDQVQSTKGGLLGMYIVNGRKVFVK